MKKLTTHEFIDKAKQIHGNKYDYSNVEYVNAHTKVCIICPEHGEFWQTPNGHLNGKNCPTCGYVKRGDKQRHNNFLFIEQAKKVHGDKYDYSKVEYVNNHTKVCIICPEHGEFWQLPTNHLKGQGCAKCLELVDGVQSFINKAKKVHGDKYDYSKVEYINTKTKVCIICPEHGEFWQTPNNHLNGKGCSECGNLKIRKSKLKSQKLFIEQAHKIHGDRYNYDKVQYIDGRTKVCIICPKHGEFWQKPSSHLWKKGCPLCCQSHLEEEVSLLLLRNNINFEYQKKFDWLKNKATNLPLSFDFYLPEYNIAIECQGEQHFKPVKYFGGEESYKIVLERDLTKINLATNNNITLLHYINNEIKVPKQWSLYNLISSKNDLIAIIKKTIKQINYNN